MTDEMNIPEMVITGEYDKPIIRVEIGSNHIIIIDKLYGPRVMAELRITQDYNTNEWIIERQVETPTEDGDVFTWVEAARITGDIR
jgi:hypothetical protein